MDAQKQAEERRQLFSQTLLPRTVANPTYDYQGKNPCDKDTRTEVLAEIMGWITDSSLQSQNFLWLTGDPGCGKSAVTASIARNCKDNGTLWAQFFINRNNVETTDPNSYFPSIARQLVNHSLDVERAIYHALKEKPSLMDSISPEQAAKLFLDAIRVASRLDPHKPVVVVIDGLDETDRARLKDTAMIFSHLFRGLTDYRNVKVFISSRTEDDIRNPFARHMKDSHVKHVHLDTAAQSSIDDVATFLRRKMVQIVEENDLNWMVWPGEKRMAVLAIRASGLFIWAITVARFLQEQIDTLGTECLNDVLDMITTEDLGDINHLYNLILRQTYRDKCNAGWEYEKFRRIVGAVVVLREPLRLHDLRLLLDIRQTASCSPVDVINFIRRLRTVLVAGADVVDDDTVPRLHKSFYEFIISQKVSSQFRINPEISEMELVSRCLCSLSFTHTHIPGLPSDGPGPSSVLPCHLRYAFRYWSSHLHQAKRMTSGLLIHKTLSRAHGSKKLLSRCSQASNTGRFGPLHIASSSDRSQITVTTDDQHHIWDVTTGQNTSVVFKGHHSQKTTGVLKGHHDAVTCVAFSPSGEYLVSGSLDTTLILWDLATAQPIRERFEGHTGAVYSVVFSPNGYRIVSGSQDHTIRVWSTRGSCLVATLNGHAGPVRSVVFSNDGDEILSGSEDCTVRRWSWRSDVGRLIGDQICGHTDTVSSVAYSPNDQMFVSGSLDGTVRLWYRDGQLAESRPLFHNASVWSIAIAPNNEEILSGHAWGISLWNAAGLRIQQRFTNRHIVEGNKSVRCVAFSPDGNTIAHGTDGNTLHLLNGQSRHRALQPIMPPLVGHTNLILSVAFSPDGSRVASGSKDHTIRIWDVPAAGECTRRLTSVSPDGHTLASMPMDKTHVQLWDLRTSPPTKHVLRLEGIPSTDLKYVAFSADGSRIAGVYVQGRRTFMCLWDTSTLKFIALRSVFQVSAVTSLFFVPDRNAFCAIFQTSSQSRLVEQWFTLEGEIESRPTVVEEDIDEEDDYELTGTALHDMNWFRPKKPGLGLWVILDNCVMRASDVRSVMSPLTIVPHPSGRSPSLIRDASSPDGVGDSA